MPWTYFVLLFGIGSCLAEDLNTIDVLDVLGNYGYVPHVENGLIMLTQEQIVSALSNFQLFAQINQTGKLDSATLQKMMEKRCGVPDLLQDGEYGTPLAPKMVMKRRKKRYVLSASEWKKPELSYMITSYTDRISKQEIDDIISKAFQKWANVSLLSFKQVSTLDEADIRIDFATGAHDGCNYPFDGPGGVLGHAYFPDDGRIHFDNEETWATHPDDGTNLLFVATHELGHTLGLKHSTKMCSIMAPFYSSVADPQLCEDDISAMTALYPTFIGPTRNCKLDTTGVSYVGTVSKTEDGIECQRWIDQYPHSHGYTADDFSEGSLSDQSNYCRNPDPEKHPFGPWCYTTNASVPTQGCNVLQCKQNVVLTRLGKEYIGTQSTTAGGHTCQNWTSTSPHNHYHSQAPHRFPYGTVEENKNYCRNPDDDIGGNWCYTTDPDVRWGYCNIPYSIKSCQIQGKSKLYDGTASTTKSGKTCQRWDSQTPHAHDVYDARDMQEATLSGNVNYCRNPKPDERPEGVWCYTTDPDVEWEYCDVPLCSSTCRTTEQALDYKGQIATSQSGYTCQRWDKQYPHRHYYGDAAYFPDDTIDDAANFCRNPDKDSRPWCYTTDPSFRWEFCNIKICS